MIAAIVLAAGLARRMGRQKLLLDLKGKPVIRWSIEGVLQHVDDFDPTELELVATAEDGSAVSHAAATVA